MRKSAKIFIPSTSDIKILRTIQLLNSNGLFPLPQGVYKILSASGEDEFLAFREYPTYGTILSYSSKHISRLIMMLLRNHYLEKVFDRNTEELYLSITPKGEMFLRDYDKKHKYSFKKKSINKKPLIVKLVKWGS